MRPVALGTEDRQRAHVHHRTARCGGDSVGLSAGVHQPQEPADQRQVALLEALPNILDAEVPEGRDEADNVVLHQHGTPPVLDFPARQHFEIGEALGEASPDRWLTIMFTTDREWTI